MANLDINVITNNSAKGNGRINSTALVSCVAGASTVTVTAAPWFDGSGSPKVDIGAYMIIRGTGPNGSDTYVTVTTVNGTTNTSTSVTVTPTGTSTFATGYPTTAVTIEWGHDDTTNINNSILAASGGTAGAGTVYLPRGTYLIGSGSGLAPGGQPVHMYGELGTIIKTAPGRTNALFASSPTLGGFNGWVFENIIFDGQNGYNVPGASNTFIMSGSRNMIFRNCVFRNINGMLGGYGMRDIRFDNCIFYGTEPGQVTAGTWNPTAVNPITAPPQPGTGIAIYDASNNVRIEHCTFHMIGTGMGAGAPVYVYGFASAGVDTLIVSNCDFRGDWFNNPFVWERWAAGSYSFPRWWSDESATGRTPYPLQRARLQKVGSRSGKVGWTCTDDPAGGGKTLPGLFANGATPPIFYGTPLAFRWPMTAENLQISSIDTNTNKVTLSTVPPTYPENVGTLHDAIASGNYPVKVGDILETDNGIRGEIMAIRQDKTAADPTTLVGYGATTANSATVTTTVAFFTSTDCGKSISLPGAASDGSDISTTILTVAADGKSATVNTTSSGTGKCLSAPNCLPGKTLSAVTFTVWPVQTGIYYVRGWESMDTFEPTAPPNITDSSTSGKKYYGTTTVTGGALQGYARVSRYFATRTWSPPSPTYETSPPAAWDGTTNTGTIDLATDPWNPLTGDTMGTDNALTPSEISSHCEVLILNQTGFNGIQIQGYRSSGVIIKNNTFRGSFSDSISLFHTDDAIISSNYFISTQDCGVGLNQCQRPRIVNNTMRNLGTYGAFLGRGGGAVGRWNPQLGCDGAIIMGNSFFNWGMEAYSNPGCVYLKSSSNCIIAANTFQRDTTTSAASLTSTWNKPHNIAIGIDNPYLNSYVQPQDNTIIFGNNDGRTSPAFNGSKTATLYVVNTFPVNGPARNTLAMDISADNIYQNPSTTSTPSGVHTNDENYYRPLGGASSFAVRTKSGTPVDGDFYYSKTVGGVLTTTPPDGTVVLDTAANKIWVRSNGTWKYATLT
jgi:hypothetical protein